jgi:hypothetical protein
LDHEAEVYKDLTDLESTFSLFFSLICFFVYLKYLPKNLNSLKTLFNPVIFVPIEPPRLIFLTNPRQFRPSCCGSAGVAATMRWCCRCSGRRGTICADWGAAGVGGTYSF